ncbi:MAG: FCD domain-containing protein [Marmoricola sp.]|nr:FCD domain-containing protein [Marmoricola sp.]
MISGQSASLAAVRGSTANVKTMQSFAERVGSATSSLEARRGHGRFHLELASAAQSKRLTRAEFSVHEQIDWLFGLALSTPDERAATAHELMEIADAVSRRKPDLARERAERQVGRLVSRLAQLRLEVLASSHPKPPRKGSSLQAEVRSLTKAIGGELAAIAAEAAPALEGGMSFQEARTRVSLAVLKRFEAFPAFVKGVGVITDVGVLPDQPYWIQWWLRTENGPVEDNHHVTDPDHEDFYDYQNMEIMTRPRETGRSAAHGPYVDYGGVDDYIITVSSPIMSDGRFLGISLVDILVADLESWLAPWLADGTSHVLLNADNRVIVSNTVRFGVGEVLADTNGGQVTSFPQFGWTLVTSNERD